MKMNIKLKVCRDCNDDWKLNGKYDEGFELDGKCMICNYCLFVGDEYDAFIVKIELVDLLRKIMKRSEIC